MYPSISGNMGCIFHFSSFLHLFAKRAFYTNQKPQKDCEKSFSVAFLYESATHNQQSTPLKTDFNEPHSTAATQTRFSSAIKQLRRYVSSICQNLGRIMSKIQTLHSPFSRECILRHVTQLLRHNGRSLLLQKSFFEFCKDNCCCKSNNYHNAADYYYHWYSVFHFVSL